LPQVSGSRRDSSTDQEGVGTSPGSAAHGRSTEDLITRAK